MRVGKGHGFTIVEALVVISIIAVLTAIGFAVSGPVREKARETSCSSQLRQLHQAVLLYSVDVDAGEEVPGLGPLACGGIFRSLSGLLPYLRNADIRYCPNFPPVKRSTRATSYVWMPIPRYFFQDSDPGERRLLDEQTMRIEKVGTQFPMWLCRTHDETYYQPSESHISNLLTDPFIIEISVAGSISSGRKPYVRGPAIP